MGIKTEVDQNTLSAEIKSKYTISGNSFSKSPKLDPRDKIVLEIGDSKQVDFYPQVKLMRWDNEVNFSARLVDEDPAEPVIGSEADILTWKKQKKEIRFYEMPESELHPDGAFEFEIALKEKPATNIMAFSLQTKGLDFFYQPELTEAEKKEGRERPEEIAGSYAAYHSQYPTNYKSGKIYRTGKAFHIYRPRIEDALGNWVWGVLNIDDNAKELTVTIPQEFLDTAVYPVIHAAGLTLGYTSNGASAAYYGYSDYMFGAVVTTPAASIRAASMFMYGSNSYGSPAPMHLQGGLYKLSDGSLLSPLGGAILAGTSSRAWLESAFSGGLILDGNTDYVLTNFAESYSSYYWRQYYDTGASPGRRKSYGTSQYPTWENPITWDGTLSNTRWSIYITYEDLLPVCGTTGQYLSGTWIYGHGDVTSAGAGTISERGIVWSTSPNPTIADHKTTTSGTIGSWTYLNCGEHPGGTIYMRCFATNEYGTAYGTEVTQTMIVVPTLAATTAASNIGTDGATSGGNVTNDGGATITERGICWSTSQNPTTANSKQTAAGTTGSFSANLTGLASGTTYYVRAYAINSAGTSYGTQISFTTISTSDIQGLMGLSADYVSTAMGLSGANIEALMDLI